MRLLLPFALSCALAACSGEQPDRQTVAEDNRTLDPETSGFEAFERPVTVNCDRARGQADQAICADKALIALDRELAPIPGAVDERWIAERGECGHADDLRACLLDHYAVRIANVLQQPRTGGLIVGPVDFRCGDESVRAVFLNSDPGAVHLTIGTERATLPSAPAASGARYAATVGDTGWSFWNKGREARLARGGAETNCEQQATP